jgi:hypothetical protein
MDMKKIIKTSSYLVFILLIVFSCCKKQHTVPNLLKGKIKRIQETIVVPNSNYYYDLYFFYDSTDGLLKEVVLNNKVIVKIYKKESNYIILDYDASYRDSTLANPIKIKVYINNYGFINKIVPLDSALNPGQDLLDIYTVNGYPDSISAFYFESKQYDFKFQDNNIIESKHSYVFYPNPPQTNVLNYRYSVLKNTNKLVFQNTIRNFYSVGFTTISTDPIYLLSINGYFPFKNNNNLLDSIIYDDNSFVKFDYVTNSSNEIITMKSFFSNTNYSTFDMEYY